MPWRNEHKPRLNFSAETAMWAEYTGRSGPSTSMAERRALP
jgi:hypothetical protein